MHALADALPWLCSAALKQLGSDPGLVASGLLHHAFLDGSDDNCSCALIQIMGKAGASGKDDGFKEGTQFVADSRTISDGADAERRVKVGVCIAIIAW